MIFRRLTALAVLLVPALALAQSTPPAVTLPTVIVTATSKTPEDVQSVPASVTAVTADTIRDAGVRIVSDAGLYAPNTVFQEFTARKLSNARFRGIGSSPSNPGVTTYIDGVPQLNVSTSSIELLDVDQIEFVRGPQSALYGRNTLGGLINITSSKPATAKWTYGAELPVGTFSAKEVRFRASGPVNDKVAVSGAFGKQVRNGYTVNDTTGRTVDDRNGTFAKAQMAWTINKNWDARTVYSYERDRDGDYALGDLAAIRKNPFHVTRDFEGYTNRNIHAITEILHAEGDRFAIHSSTGFVKWTTHDETDLDYTPLPLATRDNAEQAHQFTEEIRISSPTNAPVKVNDAIALRWLGGIELFTQDYNQNAKNHLAPFVLSPQIPFAVTQTSPAASINDSAVALFGQGVLTIHEKLDVTAGVRFDHQNSKAGLTTSYEPQIAPASNVNDTERFNDASPQFAAAYRVKPDVMAYGSVAKGFKSGGFNAAALPGSEAYDSEKAWHTEGGVKSTLMHGKVSADAAVFVINWDNMQLNVPNPFVPGQYYISNVGSAASSGVEFSVVGRPYPTVDVFGTYGFTHATFGDTAMSSGVSVAGNKVPYTPGHTAVIGTQVKRAVTSKVTAYGRAEAAFFGGFQYDDQNTASQDAYSIINLRGGARSQRVFLEMWLKNAGDSRYVPIAFSYPGLAPSGFIGEMGRPRTFGMSIGVNF